MVKPFALVVAFDSMYGIGKNGGLPWHLPADLKHFKAVTSHVSAPGRRNAVIMGRKTWESLPEKFRPLPNRFNVVLTREANLVLPADVLKANGLEQALQGIPKDIDKVFVIGGGQVFTEGIAHPLCQKLYITHIKGDFACDTFFPPIVPQFMLVSASEQFSEDGLFYQFCDYWRS